MTVAQLARERRDRRRITILLIALGLVLAIGPLWGVPHIESTLSEITANRVAERGWDGVVVEYSGRDATLTGSVPPGTDAIQIAAEVAAIWGVRRVQSDLTLLRPGGGDAAPRLLDPPSVRIRVGPAADGSRRSEIEISGTVPSSLVRADAIAAADVVFGASSVAEALEVGLVADAGWLNTIWQVIPVMHEAGTLEIALEAETARLAGVVTDPAKMTELESLVRAAVGSELEVVNELGVAPSVDPELTIISDGRSVMLEGRLPEASIGVGVARAADVFGDAVDNRVLGGNVRDAGWLPGAWDLLPLLAEAGSVTVRIEGDSAVLTGDVFPLRRVEELEAALATAVGGDNFAVLNRLAFDVAAAARACPAEELNQLVDSGVLFDASSAVLSAEGRGDLDGVVALLAICEGVPVEIAGHTDSSGAEAFNLTLSEARAQAVVDYLVSGGIESGRLIAVGYGETQPVADNATAAGRAANRRIEFIVGGAD